MNWLLIAYNLWDFGIWASIINGNVRYLPYHTSTQQNNRATLTKYIQNYTKPTPLRQLEPSSYVPISRCENR